MHGLKKRKKFLLKKLDGERLSNGVFWNSTTRRTRKMSRRQCCVWGCHNRKGRCAEDIAGNLLCGCPVLQTHGCPKPELLMLHNIEKMPEPVKRAVTQKVNITRQGPSGSKWQPSKDAVICNIHYLDFKGPSKGNKDFVPVYFKRPESYPALPPPKKRRVIVRCATNTTVKDVYDSSIEHHNDDDVVHTEINDENDNGGAVESNSADHIDLHIGHLDTEPESTVSVSCDNLHTVQPFDVDVIDNSSITSSCAQIVGTEPEPTVSVSCNDLHTVQPLGGDVENSSILSRCTQLEQENRELRAQVLALKQTIDSLNCSVQRLNLSLLSDYQVQMYTGLPRKTVECLLTWLQPVSRKKGANNELAPSQKLLLVLMRLRCNFPQNDLACRFNIEQSSVSRILNQWIPMLKVQLKALIRWPQTTIGPTDSPYNLLPNAVAIIDGTEIFIQKPSNLATQKSSYSDYKSHTTVKYLVGIDTFTGVFIYVSPGFSGNSSDRFTIQNSGILDELKPGQRILADKGYNARDLFAQKRCFLTIPSFLSEGRLTAQEGMQSRTIASVRIRVENAIKRLKEFKILSETLSNRVNKKIVDDMVMIVSALCNLKQRLIK